MDWASEGYVRFYTRNTVTWVTWPWETRAVFPSLLRACGADGVIDTQDGGLDGLAALLMLPREVVEAGVAGAVRSKTASWDGRVLTMPNYRKAQYASRSDGARQRESRERRKACDDSHDSSHDVTPSDGQSQTGCKEGRTEGSSLSLLSEERSQKDSTRERRPRRLPDGWEPKPETVQGFRGKGFDPLRPKADGRSILDGFRDYWLAATKNATKLDWDAAFRVWVSREVEAGKVPVFVPPRRPVDAPATPPTAPMSKEDQLAAADALLALLDTFPAPDPNWGNQLPLGACAPESIGGTDAP